MSSTILLVEDNAQLREGLELVLSESGYSVLEACSSEEALRLLHSQDDPPSLILADLVMPGMNGDQLCLTLRREPGLAAIPFVLMSAMTGAEDQARACGAEFLAKPFDLDRLLALVAKHGGAAQHLA